MFYQMGYIGGISLLLKFQKSFLPPIWNELFTLLFKSLSERVSGSDSPSKFFYTLIYGLYTGINMDFGSVQLAQFVQSTSSTIRDTKIFCAHF